MKVYDHFFGKLSLAPSELYRRWDHALLGGLCVFTTSYCASLYGISALLNIRPMECLWAGFASIGYGLSMGSFARGDLSEFSQTLDSPHLAFSLIASACAVSLGGAFFVTKKLLKPRSNTRHLDGDELKKGKDAERYARLHSPVLKDRFDVKIGTSLVLPKEQANRGFLISGGIGSGKTVIMTDLYAQHLACEGSKSILYDVKGDYTSRFPDAMLLSPFDARSMVWDIAKDIRTQTQIENFAHSLFPDTTNGKDKFFLSAATGIAVASLLYLHHRDGTNWGWRELEAVLNRTGAEHLETALLHNKNAAMLISDPDSQTTSSILATVASGARVVASLSHAFGDDTLITGSGNAVLNAQGQVRKRVRFSLMDWMKDDTKGPRHIILQGGPDKNLTRAFVNAVLNVLTPELISVSFPDNGRGRHIGIFLDEMPSLGKLDLGGLMEQGRSKGIVNVWAYQDLAQLEETYGANMTKALGSMVGTKIVCQMGAGQTRTAIAENFGSRQMVSVDHRDGKATEIGKAVVYAHTLGHELGKFTDKDGWGIKAIVETSGLSPMLLSFRGKTYQEARKPLVRAFWTRPEALERLHQATTAQAIAESVLDTHLEKIERKRFQQDKNDYYKDLRAMRYSAGKLGLTPDEVDELLDELKPKFLPKFTRPKGGFVRNA